MWDCASPIDRRSPDDHGAANTWSYKYTKTQKYKYTKTQKYKYTNTKFLLYVKSCTNWTTKRLKHKKTDRQKDQKESLILWCFAVFCQIWDSRCESGESGKGGKVGGVTDLSPSSWRPSEKARAGKILCQSWVRFWKSDAAVSNTKTDLKPKHGTKK